MPKSLFKGPRTILFCCFFLQSAWADWTPLVETSDSKLSIDTGSMVKAQPGQVQARFLVDYKQRVVLFGIGYSSIISDLKFDCLQKTRQMLSYTAYEGAGGSGLKVASETTGGEGPEKLVRPDEIELLQRVCEK